MRTTEIRIAGSGGQGVVLAGQILGRAAVSDGLNAVQTQTYGAEARGSLAKSEIIISSGKIGFPIVRRCDFLMAMNQEAADRNAKDLKESGIFLVNTSMVKSLPGVQTRSVKIAATEIAVKIAGSQLYGNMVMLGAFIQVTSVVTPESVKKAVLVALRGKAEASNLSAFEAGLATAC